MKKFSLILGMVFFQLSLLASPELTAYYKVTSTLDVAKATNALVNKLKSKDYAIIGNYSPMSNSQMKVIVFTRSDLQKLTVTDKSAHSLASILKFGIYNDGNTTEISLLNPEYVFYAYLQDKIKGKETKLKVIADDLVSLLNSLGNNFTTFGGKLSADDLKDYHYMFGMPYFDDFVGLNTFSDFSSACKIIETNLNTIAGIKKVFVQKYSGQQVAIYGIALLDTKNGESFFLPKIGKTHIAAMPYELMVTGNKVIMLHGRYRFALLWPELSMSEFMQIVDVPGFVEDTFKKVAQQ